MNLLPYILISALGLAEDGRPQFAQNFRDKSVAELSARLENQAYAGLIKSEPEGLRITLPADKRYREAVGFLAPTPVRGDFEITAAYEILDAKRPTANSFGVGVELYIKANAPSLDGVAYYRITRNSGQEAYSLSQMRTDETGKRGPIRGSGQGDPDFPSQTKIGQLRMTRVGSKLILSAADDLGQDFKAMYEVDFVPDDLTMVRIGAHPGGAPNPVDVRLLDLRVKPLDATNQDVDKAKQILQDLTRAIDTTTTKATGETPGPRRTWLWVIALLVALSLVIGGVIVILIGKRKGARPTESEPADEPVADRPPPAVLAQCSGCGKKLKVRAELAGKKVKCSQCGQVMVVPTNA